MSYLKHLLLVISAISLSVPLFAMQNEILVKELHVKSSQVPSNLLDTKASLPDIRDLFQIALHQANISDFLTQEEAAQGSYGVVCFTNNHAVKISDKEYGINLESEKLEFVTNVLNTTPIKGIDFCTPTHIFKVYMDNKSERVLENTGMTNEKVIQAYNIQIMPRLKLVGKDMLRTLKDAVNQQNPEDIATLKCFGQKLGQLHASTLVRNRNSFDTTYCHLDLNPGNIIITKRGQAPTDVSFTFIDLADSTFNEGSLVCDITYFISKSTEQIERPFESSSRLKGLKTVLENLYIGYVPQLPKDVCLKLKDTFYKLSWTQSELDYQHYWLNDCHKKMKRDTTYKALCAPKIHEIQSNAFFLAYETIYGNAQPKQLFAQQPPQILMNVAENPPEKAGLPSTYCKENVKEPQWQQPLNSFAIDNSLANKNKFRVGAYVYFKDPSNSGRKIIKVIEYRNQLFVEVAKNIPKNPGLPSTYYTS